MILNNKKCDFISIGADYNTCSIDIGWLGFPDLSTCKKTLIELIYDPCGEFRWTPEGPASQIHSPHVRDGVPGIFSDILRSVQMLRREWVRKGTWSYRTYPSLVKLHPGFLSLRWKTCLWVELRPWFLCVNWRIYPWAVYSDDIYTIYINLGPIILKIIK